MARKRTGGADKSREVPFRVDGQVYARATQMLGNGRLMAACDDGRVRLCKIRGSMRRRDWVRVGDTVLVALRSFQDDKADVVFRYEEHEARRLARMGEIRLPDQAQDQSDNDDDHQVTFEDDDLAMI